VSTRQDSRGQAVVELAITLPIVVVMALAVLQVAVIGRDQLALWHAVRVAVRAAAVSTDPVGDADVAARVATSLSPLSVATDYDDEWVRVEVRHTSRTSLALVGGLLPDIIMTAHATMRREPP
jgi:Flp pilus assembly protein TadG